MEKKKVIVIIGPTAVGKTDLSLMVAHKYNCEIINGDSMQVYKGYHVGTAKILPDEQEGIPHHLLDIRDVDDSYSVADFQRDVRNLIDEIHSRNRIPLIVGGTGLYVQAALTDYQFVENETNTKRREELEVLALELGPVEFHKILKDLNEEVAATIHPNNMRRVIRAIEKLETKDENSSDDAPKKPELLYNVSWIALTMERSYLYDRINRRVDMMMNKGLLHEAKSLFDTYPTSQLAMAIGYKEFFPFFKGEESIETAVDLIKQHSRNYAKRQFTWFRNKMDVDWYDVTNGLEEKKQEIFRNIEGKLTFVTKSYVRTNEEDTYEQTN